VKSGQVVEVAPAPKAKAAPRGKSETGLQMLERLRPKLPPAQTERGDRTANMKAIKKWFKWS